MTFEMFCDYDRSTGSLKIHRVLSAFYNIRYLGGLHTLRILKTSKLSSKNYVTPLTNKERNREKTGERKRYNRKIVMNILGKVQNILYCET